MDLAGVGQDHACPGVQVLVEGDGGGQGRPQELERVLNQELELRGGTLLLGAAAKRENLLHESGGPLARPSHGLQMVPRWTLGGDSEER